MQTLVRWDYQPGLWKLSFSGQWQTRSHTQSWSANCRAASRACRVSQSRQIRAARARVCRGICGSSPHGSSLWEGAAGEAHLHTDSLPQPHVTAAALINDWARVDSFYVPAALVVGSERRSSRKSQIIPGISPKRHFFSTSARAQPSWVEPRMHCWGGEAVVKRHSCCSWRHSPKYKHTYSRQPEAFESRTRKWLWAVLARRLQLMKRL